MRQKNTANLMLPPRHFTGHKYAWHGLTNWSTELTDCYAVRLKKGLASQEDMSFLSRARRNDKDHV